jgi:hypothetical protein
MMKKKTKIHVYALISFPCFGLSCFITVGLVFVVVTVVDHNYLSG